jgi:hypothetical protein
MNLPHIERMDFAADRLAEWAGGKHCHVAMRMRDIPLNIERAALKAAVACGVRDLDNVMQRNARGNLTKNYTHADARGAMYSHMQERGYSYPEIAKAFNVGHPGVIEAVHRHRAKTSTHIETKGEAA